MFNEHGDTMLQDQVKYVLQVQLSSFEAKYLGLPTPSGRMKRERFQSLKDRLSKRLTDYSKKCLSSGAKELLIKAVAQALPTYIMSVFHIPDGLCDDMTSLVRNFWWGSENGRRKVAWVVWEHMTQKKCSGGIGFKDMRLFNQALLARQAWRLIEFPDSLCARLLKAKYYPRGSLIDTAFRTNASVTRQSVQHGLDLLKKRSYLAYWLWVSSSYLA
jgi:hypothetical protein